MPERDFARVTPSGYQSQACYDGNHHKIRDIDGSIDPRWQGIALQTEEGEEPEPFEEGSEHNELLTVFTLKYRVLTRGKRILLFNLASHPFYFLDARTTHRADYKTTIGSGMA